MEKQYVGIDLHRRRSVIVRMTEDGEVLECVRIVNDPVALSVELAKAGPDPEVALESTSGWYWAADLLAADGANVHLVHPLGLHWDARRVKTTSARFFRNVDLHPSGWGQPARRWIAMASHTRSAHPLISGLGQGEAGLAFLRLPPVVRLR